MPTAHSLNGLDAILSTLQMPAGVPVATFAAGTAGATNAGIFAAQMIATTDDQMAERMKEFKKELREKIAKDIKKKKIIFSDIEALIFLIINRNFDQF